MENISSLEQDEWVPPLSERSSSIFYKSMLLIPRAQGQAKVARTEAEVRVRGTRARRPLPKPAVIKAKDEGLEGLQKQDKHSEG